MVEQIRLQKLLAQAGIGSRRYCEILIERGRVSVNGQIVTELGSRASWADEIRVDGVLLLQRPETVVYLLNKPRGVVSAMSDPHKRSLGDLVANLDVRLFHVGRLDEDTEGLLILTNDGELAQRLAHPSFEVAKTYLATVAGRMGAADCRLLETGIELEDGPVRADRVRLKQVADSATLVELVLHSGRNRIVRRMLAATGHPVQALVRTRFGNLGLDGLPPGGLRKLNAKQIQTLSAAAKW